ncbi:MAG: vegetative protein [Candidatus Binatia bacterium]
MANKGTCKATGCEQPVRAKQYCERHYRQWRRGKLPKARYRSCTTEGCHKPRLRRGLCSEHFAKEYQKAKPETAPPSPATAESA